MNQKHYQLPNLPYGLEALEPIISEKQLLVHYEKHHMAYINGANAIIDKLAQARESGADVDMKAVSKALSFNIAGHILHTLFWENMAPAGQGAEPSGKLLESIKNEFGSIDQFKKEFSQAALTVEGSGWAALAINSETEGLLIMQIEKHNFNVIPGLKIILVLDVFEHAYYLDYANDRAKYIQEFWQIVNWKAVEGRLI